MPTTTSATMNARISARAMLSRRASRRRRGRAVRVDVSVLCAVRVRHLLIVRPAPAPRVSWRPMSDANATPASLRAQFPVCAASPT